jgi:uncharacterized protein YqfA (UPF0365 family)
MTSTLLIALFGILAVLLALALAFVPMRLMLYAIAKSAQTKVREFIQRQRDRRAVPRSTPDRRA